MSGFDRRAFLGGVAAMAAGCRIAPRSAVDAVPAAAAKLEARHATVDIVGAPHPGTPVWCFNGQVPGPEIRVRQGDKVRILVGNALTEGTTVHWHGVRVPNAMDGVPGLTQEAIAPGGTFLYEFEARDAGTFWYHPHSRSYEQVDRGLYGAFIVEEPRPLAVDREVTWMLDDWRLRADAAIQDDFLSRFDSTHAGRIGNTVTLNGRLAERFEVRAGERLRLRLVNAANARTFGLRFDGHRPWIVALDGHPVEPHEPAQGTIVVGASQRVDVVLDAVGAPGSRHLVRDVYYPRQAYRLLDWVYRDEPALRSEHSGAPRSLGANPLAEPVLGGAVVHEIRMAGGAMSPPLGLHAGAVWAINGVAATADHGHAPLLGVKRGQTVVLDFVNETQWPHPMHVHGHAFRVLARNGQPTAQREWRDTILLERKESARIAFVADNPGDWMLHCHVLEHQAAGMMATFRVE